MTEMDLFSGIEQPEDGVILPDVELESFDLQKMLDYMALVFARHLESAVAFKGGYMMNQLLGNDSRNTRDIDFSIMNADYYNKIKILLEKIAEKFITLGLISKYTIKESITATSSGGIDMYDENGVKILGVDIGLHNIMYGTKTYSITIGDVNAFKIERMLADKILAILSRKRFRRTKDLYDFYVLVTKYDFDFGELVYCIENRDNYDDSVWQNIPFSDTVLREYAHAWDKLMLISAFSGIMLTKPDFNTTVALFTSIALTIKERESVLSWDHVLQTWRRS